MISPRKSGEEDAVWLWETRRGHGVETEHGEGRLWTEECAYSMEQPYACTLHAVTAAIAARVKLVGVFSARVS